MLKLYFVLQKWQTISIPLSSINSSIVSLSSADNDLEKPSLEQWHLYDKSLLSKILAVLLLKASKSSSKELPSSNHLETGPTFMDSIFQVMLKFHQKHLVVLEL